MFSKRFSKNRELSLTEERQFYTLRRQGKSAMMKRPFFVDRKMLKEELGETLRRCASVATATVGLLLCAPLLHSPSDESERVPPPAAPAPQPPARVGVELRKGDTLASVLRRFGIEPPSAHAMIEKVRPFVNPRRIRPGDNFHVVLNPEDRTVEAMEFVVDDNLVRVKATTDGWLAERHEIPSVRERRAVRGTIKGSLYESGIHAGLSPQHIMDLAKVFEYDIDFFSDVQPEDAFTVLVEEIRYSDGRSAAGRILAAELEAGGDVFNGYYFVGADGTGDYYNSKGEALRRAFLRAPLSYARISSPFSTNRRHPIFRTVRPHLAIDYAAPPGTPVVAIGRGRVEFAGWRGGYGNVVDIRHAGNYVSRYAHFSGFARGLRRGHAVNAGDVIGYVGQTGHATGPHLHFEFLRGDQKINFLGLRLPKNHQLAGKELAQFARLRDQLQATLRNGDNRLVENTQQGS
jgi:murein DD-endopeptidase MepM/ murein hydrolase activator NlpD